MFQENSSSLAPEQLVPQPVNQATGPTLATQPVSPENLLAHSGDHDNLLDLEAQGSRIVSKLSKVIAFGLTIQGLYHIYESLLFVFVKIPHLEQEIVLGTVTRDKVITLSTHGFVAIFTAIVSMVFALRLGFIKEKTAHKIDSAIGVLIFLGNTLIIDFFRQIDADILISDYFTTAIQYLIQIPSRFGNFLPFL